MARPKKEDFDKQRNLIKVYLTDEQLDILEKCQCDLNCSRSQLMVIALYSLQSALNLK